MYTFVFCIYIFREEDIELQILPTKPLSQPSTSGLKSIAAYAETTTLHSTDAESLASTDFQHLDIVDSGAAKPNSTIGERALIQYDHVVLDYFDTF